jgi:hemoglobin/transferrin/lactoferrin receptor protein
MKYLILCGILLFGLMAKAQQIRISDRSNAEPVPGASLEGTQSGKVVFTDADGRADLSAFFENDTIALRCLGYKPQRLVLSSLRAMGFEVSLEPQTFHFDEVVISAARWKQKNREVTAKISVISKRDIALLQPQTAADLLFNSGEVFVQKSQQGGGSPMIRGFSANRLLYTVDGIRMNTAIFRSGNLHNVISLDPFSIESAEVFFGPGSIIYGSDALGGVMSFQTINPKLSTGKQTRITGSATSRFSSANDERTNHFDIQIGGKKWAALTSISYANYGDLRMGRHGPEAYLKQNYVERIDSVDRVLQNPDPLVQNPSGFTQVNMMQKLRYTPGKNWEFDYGFYYSETSDFARYDRLLETQSNGLPMFAIWNYGPQIWMMNRLALHHRSKRVLYDQMSIRVAQQRFEESRIDRRLNQARLRTNREKLSAWSFNADFEKGIRKQRIFYGLEFVHNDVNSKGTAVNIITGAQIPVPDRYPQSDWLSYAAYVNYQHEWSKRLRLQAGLRYTGYQIKSDFTRHLSFFPFDFNNVTLGSGAITGTAGLIWTPNEVWKISLNGSTGFRAPNVDDIGKIFDFVSGEVTVPNPGLTAEYTWNSELGINRIIGDWLKLDFTAYYTYLDNAMVRRAFQLDGNDSIDFNGVPSKVFAIQNAAFGTVYGFHAGFDAKLPAGFSISSRYNFQRGIEEMDDGTLNPSRHAAPAFGTTRIHYQIDKLQLQCYAMYAAEVRFERLNPEEQSKAAIYLKDKNGNPHAPAWYTINFKAMYAFHKNFSIQAGIENISDKRYRPYASGLVAPGRNMVISITATF